MEDERTLEDYRAWGTVYLVLPLRGQTVSTAPVCVRLNGLQLMSRWRTFKLVVNVMFPPPQVPAPAPVAQSHALVIGVGSYEHAPPLTASVPDATAVADLLSSRGVLVTSLLDVNNKELKDAFFAFVATLTEGCVAILYYAGHGWMVNRTLRDPKHYLLGTDTINPSGDDEIIGAAVMAGGLALIDVCQCARMLCSASKVMPVLGGHDGRYQQARGFGQSHYALRRVPVCFLLRERIHVACARIAPALPLYYCVCGRT